MDECDFLRELSDIIDERIRAGNDGSYTYRLYRGGVGLMGKKVGEEAVEVALAAALGDRGQVVYEAADLIYHLLVLLRSMNISLSEVCSELRRRHVERVKAGG